MDRLTRKVDSILIDWKDSPDHLPLIIKGARQIGKTEAIEHFARTHYDHIVEINFALQKEYQHIFDDGFEVDRILQNITFLNPRLKIQPGNTLLFFDELQACPNCATSLKSFQLDGRYDVICSGSLMGINYQEIESNSVGYKEDYTMYSLDFEEFLWAKGYTEPQIQGLYNHLLTLEPLSSLEINTLQSLFQEFLVLGGMPAVVWRFIQQNNYGGTLQLQQQLLLDYEEDITKYAGGLDKGKILNVYRKIPVFLGKENKKFQISKVAHGARSREYLGVVDWLANAGIINVCYCLEHPELPLKGNDNPEQYKLYFADTGLLVASLDEEAQLDLRQNRNFGTYKGALFENIVAQMLVQQGYGTYYYRNPQGTLEMDFFIRDAHSLIPVEVKAKEGATKSLNRLIEDNDHYPDIRYGIKLSTNNIGWNGKFYTFPYFLCFLLKRWLRERILNA
ncbi:MAG: ATP-binding protein [Acidaminococcus sp.]|uniref:ATP-binding protein n=1 Tax=Acidaminococcus sp. TaxID=1872103 RepID=UPI003F18BF85